MTEPGAEIPREGSCFPVTKEVAGQVLAEIAHNPRGTLPAELEKISNGDDTDLAQLLWSMFREDPKSEGVLWGGTFAYMILKRQSAERGSELPLLPEGHGEVIFRDSQDAVRGDEKLGQFAGHRLDEISHSDPEFVGALREMTKYSIDQDFIQYGAIVVYTAYKSLSTGRSLSQKLGL
ncbi:MAG: hypothetical protein HY377_01710 [Candidatus Blackburnbacteria bacterium]|nr:hypothetical protein [Candidatus Blackburnbacteria bacterium]